MSRKELYLTDEQYRSILRRMRARIATGLKLEAVDSTTMGDKYTHCSWGLCTMDPSFWERDELMFPDRGPIGNPARESSKHLEDHQRCPFDKRPKSELSGCFFGCLMFRGPRKERTRTNAVKLYDKAIKDTE